jgi:hypothetical protein
MTEYFPSDKELRARLREQQAATLEAEEEQRRFDAEREKELALKAASRRLACLPILEEFVRKVRRIRLEAPEATGRSVRGFRVSAWNGNRHEQALLIVPRFRPPYWLRHPKPWGSQGPRYALDQSPLLELITPEELRRQLREHLP